MTAEMNCVSKAMKEFTTRAFTAKNQFILDADHGYRKLLIAANSSFPNGLIGHPSKLLSISFSLGFYLKAKLP